MTAVGFTVTFHAAFRVGSAYARDGIDAALDPDNPLPGDHLKGVMRAAAKDLLGPEHPAVHRVFGSAAAPSPWAWTSAQSEPPTSWWFGRRHRVAIDSETSTAVKDHLVLGEHAWAEQARFHVYQREAPIPDEDAQITVLRVAAAAVHGLGAWRRRGLGWVGITPDGGPITSGEMEQVLAWRREIR